MNISKTATQFRKLSLWDKAFLIMMPTTLALLWIILILTLQGKEYTPISKILIPCALTVLVITSLEPGLKPRWRKVIMLLVGFAAGFPLVTFLSKQFPQYTGPGVVFISFASTICLAIFLPRVIGKYLPKRR